MATLRDWLTKAGADWDKLHIIYHETRSPGWGRPTAARCIPIDDPVLDVEFDSGYGAANCPRIIADDGAALYFPGQYDGATWLERIVKDIDYYLDVKHETPYVGR